MGKKKQKPMTRRKLDFYETGSAQVQALLDRVLLGSHILEPCVGNGVISLPLERAGLKVRTADIDPERPAQTHGDARSLQAHVFTHLGPARVVFREDVVTNPPFNVALPIVQNFVEQGCRCAFLLRLSFLEPTAGTRRHPGRAAFLSRHPPSGIIVLPRYSFTGDGKTDSVTCAWMLWGFTINPAIQVAAQKENQ